MQLNTLPPQPSFYLQEASDAPGNAFFATIVADAAGKDPPFPTIGGVGWGNVFEQPVAVPM
jgi:hypothetical protein